MREGNRNLIRGRQIKHSLLVYLWQVSWTCASQRRWRNLREKEELCGTPSVCPPASYSRGGCHWGTCECWGILLPPVMLSAPPWSRTCRSRGTPRYHGLRSRTENPDGSSAETSESLLLEALRSLHCYYITIAVANPTSLYTRHLSRKL